MSGENRQRLLLNCVDLHIALNIRSAGAFQFFAGNFAGMRCVDDVPADFEYDIFADTAGFLLVCSEGELKTRAADLGELVYALEGDLVVQLQRRRPDLLFLHAAVISTEKSTSLVTGPSGAGKSTICWGLLHHGFRYSSDELAPVNLAERMVRPYAHALCLKRAPPNDYCLPGGALRSERGYHVPVTAMPLCFQPTPPAVRHLLFVQYDAELAAPELTVVDAAEATARLYPNLLNALAHKKDGLAAAAALVSGLTCLEVRSAQLNSTCEILANYLADTT